MSFTDNQSRSDLAHTTTAMQRGIDFLNQFAPVVTSVMHGKHVKDSAHYDGRAVDVGAFNGQTVGYNVVTWQAITGAIASGRFEKIGTTWKLSKNPALEKFAREHNVELFVDEGSGPHVHFQVATEPQWWAK